ncbi:SDR family NAD(P)-dependent oxidoreductase [Nocardia sp. NPDC051570]|uniref:SDR family NAD(P)-dependent oxidoreductase n=1 Tax=Nocardia sp. NPDC051570 TaxID=3364324 RepID=UPI003789139D
MLDTDIAIVGMSARVPGARNLDEFWKLLTAGREGISHFSEDELIRAGTAERTIRTAGFVPSNGMIGGIDLFDHAFFNMSRSEAELTDPQQRIFLETCYSAMEASGYIPETFPGLISVYAGAAISTYWEKHVIPTIDQSTTPRLFQVMVGNDKDYLATRVAYKLNLRGPAYTIQTACSTSLVAIHLACQGIINGECDMAIAGGVTVKVPEVRGYLYDEGAILSADGHVRTFDATATGTVLGNGSCAVVLRPLSDAIRDRDTIYAVIKGSATNNDGANKVGFAAPSSRGQAAAIIEAHTAAGVTSREISYVEAHGTATRLGDPVEITGLTAAFGSEPDARQYCAIGSVKTNLGHLDAAAGAAGLIKTALMLRHRTLVPSLNFDVRNPDIEFESSPFYVNTETKHWDGRGAPRRAGVSAFGIGGTNAHVIVEEPPVLPAGRAREEKILVLSGHSKKAVLAIAGALADHISSNSDASLDDIAFTLAVGRSPKTYRAAICADTMETAAARLRSIGDDDISRVDLDVPPAGIRIDASGSDDRRADRDDPVSAARRLAALEDECAAAGLALRGRAGRGFTRTYALARWLSEWGVEPTIGSSSQWADLMSACLAGEMSLGTAARCLDSADSGAIGDKSADVRATDEDGAVINAGDGLNAIITRLWTAGLNVDWEEFYAGLSLRRVPLPAYPFERQRCWLEASEQAIGVATDTARLGNPLLGHNVSMLDGFRCTLAPQPAGGIFVDHSVGGHPVVPATAQIEIVLAAARHAVTEAPIALENISLRHLMRAFDYDETFQVRIERYGRGVSFEIIGRVPEGGTEQSFSSGDIVDWAPPSDPPRIDMGTTRSPLDVVDSSSVYEWFADYGVNCGPDFRTVTRIEFFDGYAFADLELPTSSRAQSDPYLVNPVVLDGAAQTAAAFQVWSRGTAGSGSGYLPVAVARIEVYGPVPEKCRARVRAVADGADSGISTVDIDVVDDDGYVMCRMVGVALKEVRLAGVSPVRDIPRLYNRQWVAAPLGGPASSPDYIAVISRIPDLVQVAADMIESRFSALAVDAASPAAPVIRCVTPADISTVLAELEARAHQSVAIVMDLGIEDTDSGGEMTVARAVFDLMKGLSASGRADIRIVVGLGNESNRYRGAVAGLLRCACLENAHLICSVVTHDDSGRLGSLIDEALRGDSLEVIYEGDDRLVPEFGLLTPPVRSEGVLWSEDHTYVITGGSGGIGRILARSISEVPRTKVALIGRADPAQISIAGLAARDDATVEYFQADVTNYRELQESLEAIRGRFGRIDGVIHGAGVIADALLSTKSWTTFRQVVEPKVAGLRNMDVLTRDDPLDFFIGMSSLASIIGSPGQSDYAFANGYIDSFMADRAQRAAAGRRRGMSLAAIWPIWTDGGIVAGSRMTQAAAAFRSRTGIDVIGNDSALHTLRLALSTSHPAVVIAPGAAADRIEASLRRAMRSDQSGARRHKDNAVADHVDYSADPRTVIEAEIARVLGQARFDPELAARRFQELGIDSLGATEMLEHIGALLDIRLPVSLIYDYPTTEKLTAYVVELLADDNSPEIELHPSSSNTSTDDDILQASALEVMDLIDKEFGAAPQ